MGQAHYTCESRQDLIMPGLVWSGYKAWQVCFCRKQGRQTGVLPSIATARQSKASDWILCLCCLRHRHNGIRRLPPKRQPISKQWAKKSKSQGDPPSTRAGGSAEGFWKIRQTVLAHLVGGIVGYYGVYKQRNGNQPPPWQAGRRRPNRWERLGVAENGLEI
ncbi:hypothetical protein CI102_2628 [Trichoderma harzianum]|nr:hypothetical protein CI102_2628 [Trichoderma harzianum]